MRYHGARLVINSFEELVFENNPCGVTNIKRATTTFGDYKFSVILENKKTLYEVAIIKDNNFIRLPGIHTNTKDEVIPYLTPENVTEIIKKLRNIVGENI
jgi:hypothetical protein